MDEIAPFIKIRGIADRATCHFIIIALETTCYWIITLSDRKKKKDDEDDQNEQKYQRVKVVKVAKFLLNIRVKNRIALS